MARILIVLGLNAMTLGMQGGLERPLSLVPASLGEVFKIAQQAQSELLEEPLLWASLMDSVTGVM